MNLIASKSSRTAAVTRLIAAWRVMGSGSVITVATAGA